MTRATVRQVQPGDWLRPLPVPRRRRIPRWAALGALVVAGVAAVQLAWWLLRLI